MQILFTGQKGIPVLHRGLATSREQRVEAVAKELSRVGHDVSVTCAKNFTSSGILHYNGIELIHGPSLNSGKSPGWRYLFSDFMAIRRKQPDVVHMHGWRSAALVRIAALLSPETTFIWTIDTLPQKRLFWLRLISWQARNVFDAISVPTRQLQYILLHFLNIRATYIPDGYTKPELPEAPVSRFGVRKNQYCVTTATQIFHLRSIAKAYQKAKTKKKLVVFSEKTPALKRLVRQFAFLHPVEILPGRGLFSLLRQAALVIHTDLAHGPEITLQAMDGARAVIADTKPVLEETLGTTAIFIKNDDLENLRKAIDELSGDIEKQSFLGKKAQIRAVTHFNWSRVTKDYLVLYHYPVIRRVPVDSLVKLNNKAA